MSVIDREGLLSLKPEYIVEAQPITARKRILPERIAIRRFVSQAAGWFLGFLATSIFIMLPLLILAIFARSVPLLTQVSADNLTGLTWNPARGAFGLTPFLVGSLWVTVLAMLLLVPISLFSAVYLSEYVRESHRKWIRPLIELLAGVPSVVYGLWGILVIVPLVRSFALSIQAEQTTGYGVLSASLVLALMVTPFMIALMDELMQATPHGTRNAAFALGATKWEVVRDVLFKYSRRGLVAAIGLGFARALGETLAIMMLVGNVAKLPGNPLDPAYPLPALLANTFGEMMSVPLYDAALMTAALLLLILVLMFNLGSRAIVQRLTRYEA